MICDCNSPLIWLSSKQVVQVAFPQLAEEQAGQGSAGGGGVMVYDPAKVPRPMSWLVPSVPWAVPASMVMLVSYSLSPSRNLLLVTALKNWPGSPPPVSTLVP